MKSIRKKIFIITILLLLATTTVTAGAVLNVSTWGFNLDLLDKNISQPFEKEYSIKIARDLGNNSTRFTKLITQRDNPIIDVVHFADYYAALAKKEGLLEKIDVSKLKNYDAIYDFAKDPKEENYIIPYTVFSYGIVYRKDLIKKPITSWKDFWREDLSGHISLPQITITQGPAFMMHMNKIWGAPEGDVSLDTAFKKIAEIKDDVVTFYSRSSELLNLFQMGEIWAAPVARFSWGQFLATDLPLAWVVPKEGMLGFFSTVSIPKGAKNREDAYKYIDFILSEKVQEAEALDLVDSPINKNVQLPPDIAEKLTFGSEQISSLVFYDLDTIVSNRDKWIERWNSIISK